MAAGQRDIQSLHDKVERLSDELRQFVANFAVNERKNSAVAGTGSGAEAHWHLPAGVPLALVDPIAHLEHSVNLAQVIRLWNGEAITLFSWSQRARDQLATCAGTDKEKIKWLLLYTIDDAVAPHLNYLRDDCATLEEFFKALRDSFNSYGQADAEWRRVERKPGETWRAFADRLRDIHIRRGGDLCDSALVDKFEEHLPAHSSAYVRMLSATFKMDINFERIVWVATMLEQDERNLPRRESAVAPPSVHLSEHMLSTAQVLNASFNVGAEFPTRAASVVQDHERQTQRAAQAMAPTVALLSNIAAQIRVQTHEIEAAAREILAAIAAVTQSASNSLHLSQT